MLYRMHLYGEWGIPHNWLLGWKYLERFNVLSNETNTTSLYDAAVAHATGLFGVLPVSPEKTLIYLQKASRLGSLEAMQALAYRYLMGHNVPQDASKALILYSKVAHELWYSYPARFWHYHDEYFDSYGNPGFLYRGAEVSEKFAPRSLPNWGSPLLRFYYYFLKFIEITDEPGSPEYMDLGICDAVEEAFKLSMNTYTQYGDHEGVLRRMFEIHEKFQGEIANADHVAKGCYGSGMALLGHLLLRGLGTEQPRIKEAEQILLHARDVLLQTNKVLSRFPLRDLGLLHHYEYRDYNRAAEFYKLAEDEASLYMLNFIQNDLSQEGLIAAMDRFRDGNLESHFTRIQILELQLGFQGPAAIAESYRYFLENANHLQSPDLRNALMQALMGNFENALWLYARSAELGTLSAMENAARILYKAPCLICASPQISPPRLDAAFRYYDRARMMGSVFAAVTAGSMCYRNGSYETAALLHLSRCTEFSRLTLGYMYEHGLGVDRDYRLAAEHYEAATREFVPWTSMAGKLLVWKVTVKAWFHSAIWLHKLIRSFRVLWNWLTI